MVRDLPGQMRIGNVLEQARTGAGLDLREVEQRTKIRVKYLQALEHETWSELPSFAYAKGFLRTYGELLGLDGEALVDEFRRQVEPDSDSRGYPLGDGLQHGGRPTGGGNRSRFWAAIAVAVLIAIAAILLVVLNDDDRGDRDSRREAAAGRQGDRRPSDGARGERAGGPVELAIQVRDPIEVCLVGSGGEALIDGQVLAAGTRERYVRERFELRFPSGFDPDQLRLVIGGKRRPLPPAEGSTAFEISAPASIRQTRPSGRGCP